MKGGAPQNIFLAFLAATAVGLVTLAVASQVAMRRAGLAAVRPAPFRLDGGASADWTREFSRRLAGDVAELSRLVRAAQKEPALTGAPDWRREAQSSREKLRVAVTELKARRGAWPGEEGNATEVLAALEVLAEASGALVGGGDGGVGASPQRVRQAIDRFHQALEGGGEAPEESGLPSGEGAR